MKPDRAVANGLGIDQVIRDVQSTYPFPEIIDEAADAILSLATVVCDLVPKGSRLLDIGCGAMDKTIVLQNLGYECFGCDDFLDPWHSNAENLDPVLAYARQSGVQVHVQDAHYTTPWELESFDAVTLVNVIEHLTESPREILNFAGSYLNAGGVILVAMPNSVNLRKRLSVVRGRTNYTPVQGFYESSGPWRGHVREFTVEETSQIVKWTGFDVVYQGTFHGMARARLPNPLLRGAFRGLCALWPNFRDSVLVAATKPAGWKPREPDQESMQKSLTASWVGDGA